MRISLRAAIRAAAACLCLLVPLREARAGSLLALERGEDGELHLASDLAAIDRGDPEAVALAAAQALMDVDRIESGLPGESDRLIVQALGPALADAWRRQEDAWLGSDPVDPVAGPEVSIGVTESLAEDRVRISVRWVEPDAGGEGTSEAAFTLARSQEGVWRAIAIEAACLECQASGGCPDCDGKGCVECDGTGECWNCEGKRFFPGTWLDTYLWWLECARDIAIEAEALAPIASAAGPAATALETMERLIAARGPVAELAYLGILERLLPVAREAFDALFAAEILTARPSWEEGDEGEEERGGGSGSGESVPHVYFGAWRIERVTSEGSARAEVWLGCDGWGPAVCAELERGPDGLYRLAALRGPCTRCRAGGRIATCPQCAGKGEMPWSVVAL